jgi:hypothetical protein
MSFNYAGLQSSASALLQKFGRQLTFTRSTKGSYNPATGKAAETISTFTKYACIFDYSNADIGTLTIEAGDRRLLAEFADYNVGDTVSIDGSVYRVVSISANQPASTGLSVDLQVRQ